MLGSEVLDELGPNENEIHIASPKYNSSFSKLPLNELKLGCQAWFCFVFLFFFLILNQLFLREII